MLDSVLAREKNLANLPPARLWGATARLFKPQ
jgi:hypothetical protein